MMRAEAVMTARRRKGLGCRDEWKDGRELFSDRSSIIQSTGTLKLTLLS